LPSQAAAAKSAEVFTSQFRAAPAIKNHRWIERAKTRFPWIPGGAPLSGRPPKVAGKVAGPGVNNALVTDLNI